MSRVQACKSQLVQSVATLLRQRKTLFSDDKFFKFYSCNLVIKNVQSNRIHVSVGIVVISHVRARQH